MEGETGMISKVNSNHLVAMLIANAIDHNRVVCDMAWLEVIH